MSTRYTDAFYIIKPFLLESSKQVHAFMMPQKVKWMWHAKKTFKILEQFSRLLWLELFTVYK